MHIPTRIIYCKANKRHGKVNVTHDTPTTEKVWFIRAAQVV